MRILNKKSNFDNLFKIIVSVIVIIVFVVIIAGLTFVVYFNDSFKSLYQDQLMVIHQRSAENIITTEYNISQNSNYILNDIDIACIINGVKSDAETRYRAIKNAKNSMSIFGFKTLDIISEKDGTIRNSETMNEVSLEIYIQKNENFGDHYNRFLNGENFFISYEENMITYFYKDYRGFIVVVSLYYDEFAQKISYSGNEMIAFYKNSNPILAATDFDETLFSKKISADSTSGEFVSRNKMYVYNRYRDVLCISSMDYGSIVFEALSRAPFVWILVVILLLFFGFVSYVVFRYVRNLIADYMQQITVADRSLKYSREELNVIKLFTVAKDDIEDSCKLSEIFESKGYSCYIPLIFMIDDVGNHRTLPTKDYSHIPGIIRNIFSEKGYCVSVNISSGTIGVLYATNTPEMIRVFYDRIQKNVKKEFGVSLSVIKGNEESGYSQMISHIPQIIQLTDYRFVCGYESFIEEKSVNINESEIVYPLDIQKRILEMCRQKNWDSVQKYFADFIHYIGDNDYTVAQSWTLMLFMNIIRNLDLPAQNADFKIMRSVTQYDTFFDSAAKFTEYLKDNAKNEDKYLSEDSFIQKVEKMTTENYCNPDYDLNMLAMLLQNTSEHISRKFKKLTNENFSQYLLNYRLKKAKEFLKDTELRVSDIAERCGFNSAAYFTTVFKKNEYMTPNEYRVKVRNEMKEGL